MTSTTTLDFTKVAEQNGDCPRERASHAMAWSLFCGLHATQEKGHIPNRWFRPVCARTSLRLGLLLQGLKSPSFLLSEPRERKLPTCTMLPAFRQPADSVVVLGEPSVKHRSELIE